jgi:GAF domain-containing protein
MPRFADNPFVTGDPRVRFYAGAPLAAADGSLVGTLCLIDRRARQLDDQQLGLLRDLADLVEAELCARSTPRIRQKRSRRSERRAAASAVFVTSSTVRTSVTASRPSLRGPVDLKREPFAPIAEECRIPNDPRSRRSSSAPSR